MDRCCLVANKNVHWGKLFCQPRHLKWWGNYIREKSWRGTRKRLVRVDFDQRKTRNLLETSVPPGRVPSILKRELFDIWKKELSAGYLAIYRGLRLFVSKHYQKIARYLIENYSPCHGLQPSLSRCIYWKTARSRLRILWYSISHLFSFENFVREIIRNSDACFACLSSRSCTK